MRVNAARNYFGVYLLELINTIRESQNFGRAYECTEIRFMISNMRKYMLETSGSN